MKHANYSLRCGSLLKLVLLDTVSLVVVDITVCIPSFHRRNVFSFESYSNQVCKGNW